MEGRRQALGIRKVETSRPAAGRWSMFDAERRPGSVLVLQQASGAVYCSGGRQEREVKGLQPEPTAESEQVPGQSSQWKTQLPSAT